MPQKLLIAAPSALQAVHYLEQSGWRVSEAKYIADLYALRGYGEGQTLYMVGGGDSYGDWFYRKDDLLSYCQQRGIKVEHEIPKRPSA